MDLASELESIINNGNFIDQAVSQNKILLNNMEEGFFIIDKNLLIQPPYSKALLKIMESVSPEGKTLNQYIFDNLQKNNSNLVSEFLDLLMENSIDEEVLTDLNPINKMEFKFSDQKQITKSKYLSFIFKRLYVDRKITGAFVTVMDQTNETLLLQRLLETEEKSKKQIEWLMSIIQLDATTLSTFMNTTSEEVLFIESLLKKDDPSNYKDILDQISRSMRVIKGNASLLNLKFFAHQVHHLEEVAFSIRSRKIISGDEFLPVVFGVQDLKQNINDLKGLVDKLSSFNLQQQEAGENSEQRLMNGLKKMVSEMAEEQDKKVQIDTDAFDFSLVPPKYVLLLKNVLTQFARNSMAYGIETAQERLKHDKSEMSTIKLHTLVENNYFILKYFDDGRGLESQKLKQKIIDTMQFNHADIESWDNTRLADVIFEPDTTRTEGPYKQNGRAVGMHMVKKEIDKHNGMIEVAFEENKFCEITVSLPLSD